MTPVRLEPAALRSRVKHSTTEPLRSRKSYVKNVIFFLKKWMKEIVANVLEFMLTSAQMQDDGTLM